MRDALSLPPVAVLAKAPVEVIYCDWHIRYDDSRSADLAATMRGEYHYLDGELIVALR